MNEQKSKSELVADKAYWLVRLGVLAAAVMMFLPAMNPSRVCERINRNLSLFTSAVSWSGLINNLSGFDVRIIGSYAPFQYIMVFSIVALVGILLMCAGGCMSLGNLKMKVKGNFFTLGGAVALGAGMLLMHIPYNMLMDTVGKIETDTTSNPFSPAIPVAMWVFFAIAVIVFIGTIMTMILLPKPDKAMKFEMPTKYKLFLCMLPFIVLTFAFSYLPLYGWRYAFFDYTSGKPLTADQFVGLKWFARLVNDPQTRSDVLKVLRNTLVMSGLGIATSWVPMFFAIMLNEIKTKWFRKTVQIFTTIPNFVSWVIVFALAFAIFSTDGFINSLFGTKVDFLGNPSGTWFKMLAWGMWKGVGWSAIIYVAGISGIPLELYEAATVDGAGRAQKMLHVTVPGLMPTYCVLLLMSIANILTNGMDQYLVFYNANNADLINVLDLYVYKLGLSDPDMFPLSTVVSMTKSIVSVILLFSANAISKLIRGESIM
jgi:putative aldouronate transport system permease protein